MVSNMDLIYWSVRSSSRRRGGGSGVSLFQPAVSMKVQQHPTIDSNVLLFEYFYMWECLHFFRQNQSLNLDKLIANYVKPTVTMRKFPDCSLNFYKSFINNHIHRGDSQFCCHFYSFFTVFYYFYSHIIIFCTQ